MKIYYRHAYISRFQIADNRQLYKTVYRKNMFHYIILYKYNDLILTDYFMFI